MKLNTVMFAAAFGLAGTAFAGGDKDKRDDTSAQMEQPAEEAQKHAEKAEKHADKAAKAAERAGEQPTSSAAEERAAEQEMEALMADEIERRVSAAEEAPEKRVFGKIIGVSQDEIILDIGGAALPVTVNRDTKIEGAAIPSGKAIQSHLRTEFQPGQLISVTYDLKNMENIALSIEELQAQGQQRPQMRQQPTQQPQQRPMGTEQPSSPMPESEPMESSEHEHMGHDMESMER